MKTLLELFPRASTDFLAKNAPQGNVERLKAKSEDYETNHQRQIPNTKSQQDKKATLERADEGKVQSVRRVKVRFTGYRVRPLDPDNFAGSCKDLLDGLRHSKLIHGDEWWRITLETAQEKVKSYKEERTVIEIDL